MKKWTLIALIGAAIVLIALSLISKTMGYVIVAAMAAVFVAYGLLWAYTKYWPRSVSYTHLTLPTNSLV